jgi:hypothetical protein
MQMAADDLPEKISNPAKRALANAGIYSLTKLSRYTEGEILKLHGIGPSAIPILREALKTKGKAFKSGK